ncbi:MAG: phosphoglucosamine mutase [Bacteroidetes bacterium]|nr:phosphoglucosamine mutase [Bacteroidota bacterium]
MPFIRSISGVRATLENSLPPEIVKLYAEAFAQYLPEGDIIIGRDGRPSGKWIEQSIAEVLKEKGRIVHLLGIVPTPTVQLIVEHTPNAVGGISITASHNPAEWNGMKFMGSDGVFLDEEENQAFWKIADSNGFTNLNNQNGEILYRADAIEQHIKRLLELPLFSEETLTKIRSKKYKIVVDAVNASGSIAVPKLLEHLGCNVVRLYCDSSGEFPHTPEPLPQNLSALAEEVRIRNADIGIAVDPDADRLVLVNELGETISEEKTIVFAAQSVLKSINYLSKYSNVIAINLSTSRMIEDIAELHNCKVNRTPVGEVNVVRNLQLNNGIFGGEGSGGVILPACHYGRDSLVGIALLLKLMATEGKILSELSDELPKYEMLKTKINFSGDFDEFSAKLQSKFAGSLITRGDGIRFDIGKSWVHVRRSNTEPIVRIISESATISEAKSLVEQVELLYTNNS